MSFDELVHHPERVRLFAFLYDNSEATFSELGGRLEIPADTLDDNLRTMASAGAVDVEECEESKLPDPTVTLTTAGERRFEGHVQRLRRHVEALD
jgi:DNA-binding MarR family transcriptional regulator